MHSTKITGPGKSCRNMVDKLGWYFRSSATSARLGLPETSNIMHAPLHLGDATAGTVRDTATTASATTRGAHTSRTVPRDVTSAQDVSERAQLKDTTATLTAWPWTLGFAVQARGSMIRARLRSRTASRRAYTSAGCVVEKSSRRTDLVGMESKNKLILFGLRGDDADER